MELLITAQNVSSLPGLQRYPHIAVKQAALCRQLLVGGVYR